MKKARLVTKLIVTVAPGKNKYNRKYTTKRPTFRDYIHAKHGK
jgi:hypothetical protein